MSALEENFGNVTVSPEVMVQLVRLNALATPGVAHLAPNFSSSVRRLFGGKAGEGIEIQIEDNAVTIDLYIVAEPDTQMLPLGQTLQREIARAIQDVVGMPVKEINVHIEDVADHAPSEPTI